MSRSGIRSDRLSTYTKFEAGNDLCVLQTPLLLIPAVMWCLSLRKKDTHVVVSFAPVKI